MRSRKIQLVGPVISIFDTGHVFPMKIFYKSNFNYHIMLSVYKLIRSDMYYPNLIYCSEIHTFEPIITATFFVYCVLYICETNVD